jgi:hypothetical protein
VYGDATRPETLVAAGVPNSGILILRLGATPEQIDRERARAHRELFGE